MLQLGSRLCGALPSRKATLARFEREHPFSSNTYGTPTEALVPRWDLWVRDQPRFGCCVGQAVAGAIELSDVRTRVSGVSIWRGARRRQGLIEAIEEGTRFEYAMAEIQRRGWDPYREGEDFDVIEAGRGASDAGDDLADELFASGTAGRLAEVRLIHGPNLHRKLRQAISEGLGVPYATGLKNAFGDLKAGQVATREHLGGHENGHAMLIVGYRSSDEDPDGEYLVRNSWSEDFAGAVVQGRMRGGLFWASASAVREGWEFYAVRVR